MAKRYVKEKLKFSEEVAKIKNEELFGVKSCGVTWYQLFRKHLAFDVIGCNNLSCDGKDCLENVINKDCNC